MIESFLFEEVESALNAKISTVLKIERGMTNINYLCCLENGEKYVVRFPGVVTNLLVNREGESEVLSKIKYLGIDVPLVYFNSESGLKITEYVESSGTRHYDSYTLIEKAVIPIKRLHQSGITLRTEFDFQELLNNYLSICEKFGIRICKDFYKAVGRLRRCENMTTHANSLQLVPCHNDPVPENFLMLSNDSFLLIDWEYGGMNNPLWDLAAYSQEANLSIDEEEWLLIQYGIDKHIHGLREMLLLNKIKQDFLWYVWAEVKTHFGSDFSRYATYRYNRGLLNLQKMLGR